MIQMRTEHPIWYFLLNIVKSWVIWRNYFLADKHFPSLHHPSVLLRELNEKVVREYVLISEEN